MYAGAMHYWRVPRARWAACLRAMHATGFTAVSTPVPWRIHEPEPGEAAWNEERDLAAFIEAARAAGLAVVLRVNPSVNAELPGWGVPDWVLEQPAVQAQTSRGTPAWLPVPPRAFPLPSLAGREYHEHVRRWYAALANAVAPHREAIEIQLDPDEPWRRGAYDLDYHSDALVWWDELAPGIAAPRAWDPANAAICAQWVAFQDHYRARATGLFGEMLAEVGLAPSARLTAVALGSVPWFPPRAVDPQTRVLEAIARGARSIDVQMAVEREQHVGAAITAEGTLEAAWLPALFTSLQEVGWPELRTHPLIAVVDTRADERYGLASSLIDPMTPVLADLLQLGPGGATELGRDPAAVLSRKWRTAVCRALELAQVPYALVPETAELAGYRAVIVPTLDRIDHRVFAALNALAEAKQTICVIGPVTPVRDELERALPGPFAKRIGKLNPGSLADLRGLAEDLVALAGELPEAWQVERPEEVRTTVFGRCVFVHNDGDKAVTAVLFAEGEALRDGITHEVITVEDGRAHVPLKAGAIRLFTLG